MDARENIIHSLLGKLVHVEVDRPIGYRHGDIVYPINYGYIPGVTAGDGEAQDAYILGVAEPVSSFDGRVIAAIRRKNDCEDKLVVAPLGMEFHQGEIAEAVHFQEQFFVSTVDSLLHKSCGVLPYRKAGDAPEFLIVYERFSRAWSLPKGHMEAGETETGTALRELAEETGMQALLIPGARATAEFSISPCARKQVVLFLGEASGAPKVREGEIEATRWVRFDALSEYLKPDMFQACAALACQYLQLEK